MPVPSTSVEEYGKALEGSTTIWDKHDYFGQYVASIMRGMPPKTASSLRKKIFSDIDAVLEDSSVPSVPLSTCETVTPVAKSADETLPAVTIHKPTVHNNDAVLGNPSSMPVPSTNVEECGKALEGSTTIWDKHDHFGQYVASIMRGLPPKTASSLRKNFFSDIDAALEDSSVPSVPLSTCETVTPVAKSADETLPAFTIHKPTVHNNDAVLGNPSSMPVPSTSVEECGKALEAEVPEGSGASSIESVPCASTSNIQFVASEMSMQDPEKSGMSQTGEVTSSESQDFACGELQSMIGKKKFDTVIDMLESVSKKLLLRDQHDHFSQHIASAMRGLPPKTVFSLKKKILSDIEAASEDSSVTSVHSVPLSTCETVTPVAKSADKTLSAVNTHKPLIGDAIVEPGQSLLSPPRGQKRKQTTTAVVTKKVAVPTSYKTTLATHMTTPGDASSLDKQTIPHTESGVAVPTSYKTTLATHMTTPGDASSLDKQTIPHTESGVPVTTSCETTTLPTLMTTSCETTTLPSRMTTSCVTTTPSARMTTSCETTTLPTRMTASCETTTLSARMTTPGDASSLDKQTIFHTESGTQTKGDLQEDSRDSGGEDVSIIVPQPIKNEEQEFKMDIEEGNELAEIKREQDLFETVLVVCNESPSQYIKEETPNLEEPSEGDPGAPPLPPVSISETLICPICNTQSNIGDDELARRYFPTHPGCVRP